MKIKVELFKGYIGTDSYICTYKPKDKQDRRKLCASLDKAGFSCVLRKITHNKEYYIFHYVVRQK